MKRWAGSCVVVLGGWLAVVAAVESGCECVWLAVGGKGGVTCRPPHHTPLPAPARRTRRRRQRRRPRPARRAASSPPLSAPSGSTWPARRCGAGLRGYACHMPAASTAAGSAAPLVHWRAARPRAQALTRANIEPALAQLKRKLMERNVAEEIADKCAVPAARCCACCAELESAGLSALPCSRLRRTCSPCPALPRRVIESVSTSLEGRKLGSFTRVSTAVQQVGGWAAESAALPPASRMGATHGSGTFVRWHSC